MAGSDLGVLVRQLQGRVAQGVLQLASAVSGGRKVAFGSGTITGSGGVNATTTVTHGLGTTPLVAFTIPVGNLDFHTDVRSLGATTFGVGMGKVDGTTYSSTQTFYWLAIG